MAVTVKSITLWRSEVDNRPGVLAGALGPLADAGANLRVARAYRFPADESRGARREWRHRVDQVGDLADPGPAGGGELGRRALAVSHRDGNAPGQG